MYRCILALRSKVFNEIFADVDQGSSSMMTISNTTARLFECFLCGIYDSCFTADTFERHGRLSTGEMAQLLIDTANACEEYQVLETITETLYKCIHGFITANPSYFWAVLTDLPEQRCFKWLGHAQDYPRVPLLLAHGVEYLTLRVLLSCIQHLWSDDKECQLTLVLRWISYRMVINDKPNGSSSLREAWDYVSKLGVHKDQPSTQQASGIEAQTPPQTTEKLGRYLVPETQPEVIIIPQSPVSPSPLPPPSSSSTAAQRLPPREQQQQLQQLQIDRQEPVTPKESIKQQPSADKKRKKFF